MPFALSPIRPQETGRVTQFEIPLNQYLGTSFDQGIHDSMFNSIMDITEKAIEDDGELLSTEDANRLYGIHDLKFKTPTYEGEAKLLNQRKQAEKRRQFYLSQGNQRGLLSGRGLAGLGVGMLAQFTNPLDLSVNFLPIVGSEKLALRMASLGKGTFRQGLARGIITSEDLALHVPAPKLMESLIQGFIGNTVAEIPHVINEIQSKADYTVSDAVINIFAGTAIGAGLHLGLTAAGRAYNRVHDSTKEAMLRKGLDQFLKGEEVRVHDLVKIDDNVIREKVKFDAQVANERILQNLDIEDVKRVIKEKYKETPVRAALRNTITGEIKKGDAHWLINVEDWLDVMEGEKIERGFLTNKDRFVSEDEASRLVGKKEGSGLVSEELSFIDPEFMTKEEQLIYDDAKSEQGTDAHGVNAVRRHRQQVTNAIFFEQTEIKQKVEEEKSRRVAELLEQERQSYDEEGRFKKEKRAEMERQVAEGRTLTPEQAKEWGFETPEKAQATLKDQEAEITKQLESDEGTLPKSQEEQLKKLDEQSKGITSAIDEAINCLIKNAE